LHLVLQVSNLINAGCFYFSFFLSLFLFP
jgi:hypothetical protein